MPTERNVRNVRALLEDLSQTVHRLRSRDQPLMDKIADRVGASAVTRRQVPSTDSEFSMPKKIYTYWETASFRKSPPPYIILGLASMKRVFGGDFVLVTPSNVSGLVEDPPEPKEWTFGNNRDLKKFEVRGIVAKSDYLRMKLVYEHGGYWLDADTLALRDFRPLLNAQLDGSGKLLWHTEQFFGALPHNEILRTASANMLEREHQVWGNPGDLKKLVVDRADNVLKISFDLVKTGSNPEYGYETQGVMLRRDVKPRDFLTNDGQYVLKLYNTPLSDTGYGELTVDEFLESDILLAKIFLSIEPKSYWIEQATAILAQTRD